MTIPPPLKPIKERQTREREATVETVLMFSVSKETIKILLSNVKKKQGYDGEWLFPEQFQT